MFDIGMAFLTVVGVALILYAVWLWGNDESDEDDGVERALPSHAPNPFSARKARDDAREAMNTAVSGRKTPPLPEPHTTNIGGRG